MSEAEDENSNDCIPVKEFDENTDKLVLWKRIQQNELKRQENEKLMLDRMQQMEREMEALRQQNLRQKEEFQAKLGKNKTLTCCGCQSAIEDKRSFWCSSCHGELKFDVCDLMSEEKHSNVICTDCAVHEHGNHKLYNYLQKLIISCSGDICELTEKYEGFSESWPSPAASLSSYLKEFFSEHCSKAEEMSKRCKSRGSFKEFSEKSHSIFQQAEECVREMRAHVSEFVKKIEACGKECEELRKNDELFSDVAEPNAASVLENLHSPLPKWGHSQEVAAWKENWKLPPDIKITFATADLTYVLVATENLGFYTKLHETKSFGPIVTAESLGNMKCAKVIPDTNILVFSEFLRPRDIFTYDLETQQLEEYLPIGETISRIECSKKVIVIQTENRIVLVSWNGSRCSHLNQILGPTEGSIASISRNGILAYTNESGRLKLFNATENKPLKGESYKVDNLVINGDGTIVITEAYGEDLYFFRTSDTERAIQEVNHDYGRMLSLISDDSRCLLFKSHFHFTIATFNYRTDGMPILAFDHKLKHDVIEESFVFLRVEKVQHLQFVTRSGDLVRYRMQEAVKSWQLI